MGDSQKCVCGKTLVENAKFCPKCGRKAGRRALARFFRGLGLLLAVLCIMAVTSFVTFQVCISKINRATSQAREAEAALLSAQEQVQLLRKSAADQSSLLAAAQSRGERFHAELMQKTDELTRTKQKATEGERSVDELRKLRESLARSGTVPREELQAFQAQVAETQERLEALGKEIEREKANQQALANKEDPWSTLVARIASNPSIAPADIQALVGPPRNVQTMSGIQLGFTDPDRGLLKFRVWLYENGGRIIIDPSGMIDTVEKPTQ